MIQNIQKNTESRLNLNKSLDVDFEESGKSKSIDMVFANKIFP